MDWGVHSRGIGLQGVYYIWFPVFTQVMPAVAKFGQKLQISHTYAYTMYV